MEQWSPDEHQTGTLRFMVVVLIPNLIFTSNINILFIRKQSESNLHNKSEKKKKSGQGKILLSFPHIPIFLKVFCPHEYINTTHSYTRSRKCSKRSDANVWMGIISSASAN